MVASQAADAGFKSRRPFQCRLAQLVERRILSAEVVGSKPAAAANAGLAQWQSAAL